MKKRGERQRTPEDVSILAKRKPKKARNCGHGYEYSYVDRERYRKAYHRLADWERKWGNYERRHPTYNEGLPAIHLSVHAICETDLGFKIENLIAVGPTDLVADLTPMQVRLSLATGELGHGPTLGDSQ